MLRGQFEDETGRPYLEGRLVISRLGVNSSVFFLVDTGADVSVLNPMDALLVGIDYSKLFRRTRTRGVGGISQDYLEQALIVFPDSEGYVYIYNIGLRIASSTPESVVLPSLLGRDILDRWRMTYDPGNDELVFEVGTADVTVPLKP